jgi:threonine/homoserine/homoserine lactone efflux protein
VIGADEFARGARAGLELLRRNPAAFARFDGSGEAALRSFWIAPLGLPLSLFSVFLMRESPLAQSDPLQFALLHTIVYAIGWMAYPVAAHMLAGVVKREAQFARYLTGYNWLNLYINLFGGAVVSALALADASPGVLGIASLALLAVYIFYTFFAARAGLGLEPQQAVGFVLADIALSYSIEVIALSAGR